MYLKRLELSGFKSFANKTALEFPAGISAIVGPNGSGKSNLADAVRWVLGEQSLKALRTKKGEELIFHGSGQTPAKGEARPALAGRQLSRATVSLLFDNKDHLFPLDFGEVSLARKIFRDGENQYFINKAQVRLKDLAESIAQAKLGLKGYTIINQGMGDAILNASPAERRQIFEEALGLKEHKLKKDEAEDKLIKTQENLIKTEGLIQEIEPHLRFLKRQLGRVKHREEITAKLEELEVAQSKSDKEDNLTNLENQKYSFERELGRLEGLLEAAKETKGGYFIDLSDFQFKIKDIKITLEKLLKEENLEKLKNMLSKIIINIDNLLVNFEKRDSTEELERLKSKKEKAEQSIKELDKKIEDFKAGAEKSFELEKELERWRAKMEMVEEIDPEIQKEFEETQKRHEFLTHESADLKKALASLEEVKENLEEKMETKFTQGFEEIKKEFSRFFKLLFDGGEADIFLAKSKDPLLSSEEKERGVEIKVSLPNKKIKSLEALSGGEKSLTALALLFALVATAKPPFLVLDEIDAALDEANSLRFTKILEELKKRTQFIIITHNRETMRAADVLYGVTMAASGLSKLLSLKLK